MTFDEWYEKNKTGLWRVFDIEDDLRAAFNAGMKRGRENERRRAKQKPSGIVRDELEKGHE